MADGIRDWRKKKAALTILFAAGSDEELARAILNVDKTNEQVSSLKGSFKSWHEGKSDPRKGPVGRDFIMELAKRLQGRGCDEVNINAAIVEGSYKIFYEMLPINDRKFLPKPDNEGNEIIRTMVDDHDTHHHMWFTRSAPFETAKLALDSKGRIDQKFHYLSPDSAEIWQAVINAGQYPQYEECRTALNVLCKGKQGHNDASENEQNNQIWANFFAPKTGNGVVMLGGGAPSKDLLIIESILGLLSPADNVNYALVDYSHYMLKSSFHMIDSSLNRKGIRSRVNLSLIEDDFLNLKNIRKILQCEDKNVAWIIPGGTFGNLNERSFFGSVAKESVLGDLLVIGVETIGSGDRDDRKRHLKDKYDNQEVRDFVKTALHAVWHGLKHNELEHKENFQKALTQIVVEIVDDEQSEHSTVPGAMTVEVSLPIGREKIVLLTSTRYDEENFLTFADKMGFKCETAVKSPLNQQYKQFVFRYNPSV